MSDETLFFVFGAVLVAAALVVSLGGLRTTSFPPSRAVLLGAVALFAGLVLATTAFALLNARDEQEQRRAELAAEEEGAAAEEGQPAAGAGTTLDLTSPEDGSLLFEPDLDPLQPDAPPEALELPVGLPQLLRGLAIEHRSGV